MTATSTLILIRHGQTALNAQGRFQGQTDTPLDATGLLQARATAERLAEEGVREPQLLSSDLPRALATAQAMQDAVGGRLETTAALREIDFGTWDQRPVSEVRASFPSEFAQFWSGDPAFVCPGGESGRDVMARAAQAVTLPAQGETRIVVAHQLTIFALLTHLLNEDYQAVWATRRFHHPNAAFSRLTYQGGQLSGVELAVSDHLPPLTPPAP